MFRGLGSGALEHGGARGASTRFGGFEVGFWFQQAAFYAFPKKSPILLN